MSTVLLDIQGLADHQRLLGKRLNAAIARGLRSGGLRALNVVRTATRYAPPANPAGKGTGGAVNYGSYLRAWKSRSIPNGVRVFNDSPYAAVIEAGRRPGSPMPPIEAIVRWAQRRLTVERTIKSGANRGAVRKRRMTEDEARRIAFVVARAIGKRGLIARRIMERSVPEMRRVVFEEVLREFDSALPGGGV